MIKYFVFILLSFWASFSYSAILQGFPAPIESRRLDINAKIESIIEHAEICYVLFSGHPAYFILPKIVGGKDIKPILESLKSKKKNVSVFYDGLTMQVFQLSY